MFPLFKRSASPADFAGGTWDSIRDWPVKHGAHLRQNFEGRFQRSIEEVFDEMIYYLAFATDFALWSQLKETPEIRKAVMDIFMGHVGRFAQERSCRPIRSGEWIGDSLVWMMHVGTAEGADPLTNLKRRFDLYRRSISRRHDRSAGERTAHILAALCGIMDGTFIAYVTPLFLVRWKGAQANLRSFKIKG
jgi:hypothetical protein